jgi:thiosulfate dehydrogenase [quinone] large subunit
MLVAFLESFKYVGHMFPVVLLRAFIGWFYLKQALLKYSGEFLFKPLLSHQLSEWLPKSDAPVGYKAFIEEFVIPHPNWVVFAYGITALEFLVAFSYLTGFLVRPLGILAALLSFNLAMLSGPDQEAFHLTLFVIHLTMAWLGAGRCFGVDYYFYKRQRGIWW